MLSAITSDNHPPPSASDSLTKTAPRAAPESAASSPSTCIAGERCTSHTTRPRRGSRWAVRDDLDWIERQSGTLIELAVFEDAHGAVLFACGSASLRELLPLRVPFDDTFVVDARPYVRPLAGIVDDTPPALIVFADGVSARLIALDASGVTGETVLEAEVPGRHESGGWADRARSRYERHILEHREQHFAAVVAAIGAWTERYGASHRAGRR